MSWRKKLRNLLEKDMRWFTSLKPVPATRWKTALQQMNSEWGEDLRRRQLHLGASPVLNACIVVLLIANTVFLGFEVDDQRTVAAGGNWFFVTLELFFATVFIGEWLIRFHHQRWDFFADNWNVFDFTLVLMGFNDSMMTLLTPLAGTQLARAYRVSRGLRVARSVRTVKRLSGLWFIIGGLLETLKTMLLVAAIASILIFVLGVALTTVVATQPLTLQLWQQASMYMGSVTRSMLTILQVATLDGWTSSIARPLYDLSPFGFFTLLFCVILLNFGTFNILVAVMVERITTMATDSKELNQRACAMAEQMVLAQLLNEFRKQDEDGNGNLSLKEFKKLIRQPNLLGKLSLLGLHANEAEELFNLLDADASGEVTAHELIQGIQKLRGPAKGQDMVYLISVVQKENWRAGCFVQLLRRVNQRADAIQVRLNSVGMFFSFAILVALVLLATRLSTYISYLVEKETGEAKTQLTQQLRSPFGLRGDDEVLDEEGQRRQIRQRFRGQLQLLMIYLVLASIISKEALQLTNSWQALYFSVVTLTTVGFGDLVPQTTSAKWIVSVLCLFGVPIFGNTMAELVALIYGERKRHVKQQLPSLSVPKLLQMRRFAQELDSDTTPSCSQSCTERRISKFEFCCFLLVQNNIIDMDDVKAISKNFGHLDISMDGYLWSKDALVWELQSILKFNGNGEEDKETGMPLQNAETLRNSLDSMDLKTAGCIELAELQCALKKNGVRTSENAVKSFFRKLDLNRDGKISFQEFRALVGRIGSTSTSSTTGTKCATGARSAKGTASATSAMGTAPPVVDGSIRPGHFRAIS